MRLGQDSGPDLTQEQQQHIEQQKQLEKQQHQEQQMPQMLSQVDKALDKHTDVKQVVDQLPQEEQNNLKQTIAHKAIEVGGQQPQISYLGFHPQTNNLVVQTRQYGMANVELSDAAKDLCRRPPELLENPISLTKAFNWKPSLDPANLLTTKEDAEAFLDRTHQMRQSLSENLSGYHRQYTDLKEQYDNTSNWYFSQRELKDELKEQMEKLNRTIEFSQDVLLSYRRASHYVAGQLGPFVSGPPDKDEQQAIDRETAERKRAANRIALWAVGPIVGGPAMLADKLDAPPEVVDALAQASFNIATAKY
ncbi:hypothetical protein [Neisseria sp. Ec49-e6-T10]|uniref:hypothetical protein n=1 Tax=Neisseria sp. Ec49-e6-T10 TaxID=3140744 RepID=UPI003EB8621C